METLAYDGPTAGQRGTKWLLWALSILYGILWYPAIFICHVSLGMFSSSMPLLIVLFLFEMLLPCALSAGVIGGWAFYAKGDFRRARRTVLAPIICLAIMVILALAAAIKENALVLAGQTN